MRRTKFIRNCAVVSFVASSLIFSSSASAAFQCSSSIGSVLVYGDGTVNVNHSGRGDYTVVCNLNSTYKGVSPSTCAIWSAMILQAKRANSVLQFYYDGAGACSTLPTYSSAPVPVYIGPTT